MRKHINTLLMAIGIFMLGFSISLLRYGDLGTDPYTTMNLGVSSSLPLSFGLYQLLINLVLFAIVWKKKRHTIGLGTIVNMVMVGFVSDFFYPLVVTSLPDFPALSFRLIVTTVAVIIACISISMYMESGLGIAPYDAITTILVDASKRRIPFFVARVTVDVLAVLIGFFFGATVGIGTLMLAFLTGPVVQLLREQVLSKLFNKSQLTIKV